MKIFEAAPPGEGPSLALHGGAGGRVAALSLKDRAPYAEGLRAAFSAGWQVLASGGSALDAVCRCVEVLENDPLFNAGRGAALTATGHAELDASVMTGAGHAGAVAASKHAKNPVLLARAVMEHTEHALIVDPDAAFLERHGCQAVERRYFITESRQQQLERVLDGRAVAARLLPDVLPYRVGTAAAFTFAGFNGRALADNAPEVMFGLVTNSAAPTGLVAASASETRQDKFPYLVSA